MGKTYTWEDLLRQAGKDVALQSYSYVSLFGMDTLDRFKSSIFENVVPIESIATGPSIETLGQNVKVVAKIAAAAFKPGLGALAEHASFLAVNRYIVCIDDLERKGEKLRIIDILGLASLLKERRKCKIVLILNDDALENEKADFDKYSEKVIDSSLMFEPTSAEAAQIAFKGTDDSDKLMLENCQKLDIANIRILKKIERLVNDAKPHLTAFDNRVLTQAVSTLVLLGWCVYAKQDELLQYTLNERYKSRYSSNNKLTDEQRRLDDLLEAYPFGLVDAFDKVLLKGIQKGFFDNARLVEEARKLDDDYKNKQMRDAVQGPWDLYRDSFDDNTEEVCDGLIKAMNEYPDYTPVNYVDGAIMFLKRLGKTAEAQKMLDDWLEVHKDEPRGFFDVQSSGFAVQDPDLRTAITDRYTSFVDNRDPAEVLFEIAKNHAWSQEDITLISKVTADEFYKMFKRLRDLKLRSVVKKALEIGRHGATPEHKVIGDNTLAALTKLRDESAINGQRVKGLYQIP